MASRVFRFFVIAMAVGLVAASCGGSDDDGGSGSGSGGDAPKQEDLDYEALGLWDDGACDDAAEPLKVGLMTTFESPVISLEDQALALEAAATAFNARGGANGSCIEVHTCDDGANTDQAVGCVREIADAGVTVTVNDQGLAGQAEVRAAMTEAGIPRVANNPQNQDWDDPNTYPLDAAGTGVTFLMPQALIDSDITDIAAIRVGQAEAAAMIPLLENVYGDKAKFPVDVPVPAGTTDFSQFILAAQDGGADGAILALGEQEAIQVVRAAEQLSSPLQIGASLGSFSHASVSDLGDFAGQIAFVWAAEPPTADVPVYDAMRADLAASGEESLTAENLKASPVRSWVGLYALLKIIRDADTTDFSSANITKLMNEAVDVDMLGMYRDQAWTPNENHPGIFKRAGMDGWVAYKWDPDAEGAFDGNYVATSEMSFDETLCGSPLGGPEPC